MLGYLWQHRVATGFGVLGLLAADAAQFTVPFLTKYVVDGLGAKQTPTTLLPYILGIAGLAFFAYAARCLWRYFLFGVARKCDIDIRRRIYERSILLDLSYHQKTTTGHIMSLATSDVVAVRAVLAFALMSAFDAIIYTMMSVWALFHLEPKLAWLTLLPFPVLGIVMRVVLQWSYSTYDRVQQSLDEMTEKARESISGMRVLRATVQGEGDAADFRRITEDQYQRFMTHVKLDGLYSPAILVLSGISAAILLGVGGQAVVTGVMTVGDFAAFASFLAQLTWPMIAAAWTLSLVQRGAASMDRILTLLEQPPEPVQPARALAGHGALEIRNLTFSYPQAQQPALTDISFRLQPGASLGLVGEVGSGKSTLTRLLLRLYDPPAGTIRLDDVDITEINLSQLRSQFAWVEQEAFLFSQSISENLKLADEHARPERLREVAAQAELHNEVMTFPLGYDTLLGERGVTLSGGQRQRLCLARALLKQAPVLVLDDTLSAVDAETEHRILTSLKTRHGRQTLLVISHRVSSVQDLDEILVLEAGKIVQRGTHQQLLASNGLYRRLYELQTHEMPA
jgi:ATP-binding cassette, subfamily B, multidrug efflux pump